MSLRRRYLANKRNLIQDKGSNNGVENKLINLAKSLSKKMKTGQDLNSDYET